MDTTTFRVEEIRRSDDMKSHSPLITIDSNVMIAALREREPASEKCGNIVAKAPEQFILTEPSIIYQEVCGTLVRKVGFRSCQQSKRAFRSHH